MRVLILGLPGSGTSAVADVLSQDGFSDAPPTFSKAKYPYPTHESLLGRAVNRIIIGAPLIWPTWRWHHDFRPRNPFNDPEVHHLARFFVKVNDEAHERWYFKNPETMMAWDTVWKPIGWDEVIGVYRHPEESIRNLHSEQKACYRRVVWNHYTRLLIRASTILLRFPDDLEPYAESIGSTYRLPPGFPRCRSYYDPYTKDHCKKRWAELEEARWQSTSATRT